MLSLWIIVVLVALFLWYITRKPSRFPPGPFRTPLIGYATQIHPTKSHLTYNALRSQYGDVVGIYLGNSPLVVVSGWEAATEALGNQDLNGRPYSVISLSNIDEPQDMRGVMFSSGDVWKTQRRFTLHHFRNLGFGKRTHQEHILEEMEELIKSITSEKGPIDVQSNLAVANINILWAVLAGVRFDYSNEKLQQLVKGVYDAFRAGQQSGGGLLFAFPFLRFVAPELLGYNVIKAAALKVSSTVQSAIEQHRRTYDPTVCRDFIDIYLKELMSEDKDASFTDKQLTTICNDVMVAGSETGSSLISYCILFLCLYPDWQEALHGELDDVLGECGERLPTMDDKSRLTKTEAFLNEILRYRCPAPTTVPHTAMQDTTLQGHRIPKGTDLLINIRSIMMDEKYWKDPEIFRPERFIDENGRIRNYERMIPFGKGKRACLGEPLARMTAFLIFAGLTSRLSFRLPPGEPIPDTEGVTGFTLGPPLFKVIVQERTLVK